MQGSDDVLRARCVQHLDEILAVRWLRACEGQLFATVLHQTQQEMTMVAVTEGVATCWGRGTCSIARPSSSSLLSLSPFRPLAFPAWLLSWADPIGLSPPPMSLGDH